MSPFSHLSGPLPLCIMNNRDDCHGQPTRECLDALKAHCQTSQQAQQGQQNPEAQEIQQLLPKPSTLLVEHHISRLASNTAVTAIYTLDQCLEECKSMPDSVQQIMHVLR